jgi:hypothetical protein
MFHQAVRAIVNYHGAAEIRFTLAPMVLFSREQSRLRLEDSVKIGNVPAGTNPTHSPTRDCFKFSKTCGISAAEGKRRVRGRPVRSGAVRLKGPLIVAAATRSEK